MEGEESKLKEDEEDNQGQSKPTTEEDAHNYNTRRVGEVSEG